MNYLALNPSTGDYVLSLGTQGRYPQVQGLEWRLGGVVNTRWYPLERSPLHRPQIDIDVEHLIRQINPPIYLGMRSAVRATVCIANIVGEGIPAPLGSDIGVGEIVWTSRRGFLTSCPLVRNALKSVING